MEIPNTYNKPMSTDSNQSYEQTIMSSRFCPKTVLYDPMIKRILKSLVPDQRVEAISHWSIESQDNVTRAQGINIFVKTPAGSEKKMARIMSIKVKSRKQIVFVNDKESKDNQQALTLVILIRNLLDEEKLQTMRPL